MKTTIALLGLFVVLPIWFFLLYTILSAIHPDRLVWFLFWVYVPLGVLMGIFEKLTKGISK